MQHKWYNSYELETGNKFEFEGVERADLYVAKINLLFHMNKNTFYSILSF